MPYIKSMDKLQLAPITNNIKICGEKIDTKGKLNYLITNLMLEYIACKGQNYQNLSDARAAALDAASEFYRRLIAPYEDSKAEENGDVYGGMLRGL